MRTAIRLPWPWLRMTRPFITNLSGRTPSNKKGQCNASSIAPVERNVSFASKSTPLELIFCVNPEPRSTTWCRFSTLYSTSKTIGYRRCERRSSSVSNDEARLTWARVGDILPPSKLHSTFDDVHGTFGNLRTDLRKRCTFSIGHS